MKELDLHGFIHFEVPLEVENFLFSNENVFPVKIITGNSDKMKSIVVDILNKNNYIFEIPAHNSGVIIVYS